MSNTSYTISGCWDTNHYASAHCFNDDDWEDFHKEQLDHFCDRCEENFKLFVKKLDDKTKYEKELNETLELCREICEIMNVQMNKFEKSSINKENLSMTKFKKSLEEAKKAKTKPKEEVKEEPVKEKSVKKYYSNEEEEAIEVEEKVIEEIKQAEEVEEGPVKAIKEAYDKYIKEQKAIKEDYDKYIEEQEAIKEDIEEGLMKKEHDAESLKVLNVEPRKLTPEEKNYIIKQLKEMSDISMWVPDICNILRKFFDCSGCYINDEHERFIYPVLLKESYFNENKYYLYFLNMRISLIDCITVIDDGFDNYISLIAKYNWDECSIKATWKKEFI